MRTFYWGHAGWQTNVRACKIFRCFNSYLAIQHLRPCNMCPVNVSTLFLFTVMICFSAPGIILLLLPQGRAITQDKTLFRNINCTSVFLFCEIKKKKRKRNNRMFKTKIDREEIVRLKELCTHVDMLVTKHRRRALCLQCGITYVIN